VSARRIGMALGLILAILIAVVWSSRGQGRRALAAYKAELIAQGEKLSVDEVVSPPAPANELADAQFSAAAARLQGCAIQPGSFRFVDFPVPGQMRPLSAVTNLGDRGASVVTWSRWESELEVMGPHLEELHRILRSPAGRSSIDYRNSFAKIPNLVGRRVAAQWLAGEAFAAAHATNNAAALEALQALLASVELHREDPTLAHLMIRVAVSGLAFDATCAVLQSPGWTDAQLAELQLAWRRPEFLDSLTVALEVQRIGDLALFEQSRTNGLRLARNAMTFGTPRPVSVGTVFEDYLLDPMWKTAWADEDQLFFLKGYQPILTVSRAARQHHSWLRLSGDLDRAYASFPTNRLDRFRHLLSLMTLGSPNRAMEYLFRAETQRSLCLAALALRRYELRHGQPPPDLAALTPELLESVPLDHVDGQPVRYRLQADHSWRLYSVGLDGRDDGGEALPAKEWSRYQSIWDGRDAVWPWTGLEPAPPAIPPGEALPLIQFDQVLLRDALRALAQNIGLNLVFDPAIETQLNRPLTLRLENVSAADALQALLDNDNLTAVRQRATGPLGITRR
jgi:hypothetical protein